MSKIALQGDASGTGTFTIASPNSNTDRTLTLPDEAGTVLTTSSDVLTSASTLSSSNLSGALPALDGSALTGVSGGKILQVVRTLSAGASSSSLNTNSWTTVPSLSVSITPSSTSSKILMFARVYYEWDAGDIANMMYAPARGGTRFNLSSASFSGSASNGANQAMGTHWISDYSGDTNTTMEGFTLTTLDSPSTTASTAYTVQIKNTNNGGTIYWNRTVTSTNQNAEGGSSEIILMEVGA